MKQAPLLLRCREVSRSAGGHMGERAWCSELPGGGGMACLGGRATRGRPGVLGRRRRGQMHGLDCGFHAEKWQGRVSRLRSDWFRSFQGSGCRAALVDWYLTWVIRAGAW